MFVPALWLCVVAMICAELYLAVHPLVGIVVILASYASIFGLAFLAKRFPTRRRGVLTVRDNVLLLDGRPILERRNIRGVFPVVASETSVLIEQRRIRMRHPITIELASREDAQALINDLGWNEAQAAQEFSLRPSPEVRFPWKRFASMLVAGFGLILADLKFHLNVQVVMPIFMTVSVLGFAHWMVLGVIDMFTKVRVGTDGVLIRLAGKKRFIPYQQLVSVEHSPNKVILHLSSGDPVELSHGQDTAFLSRYQQAQSCFPN